MKVLCVTDRADRPETELFIRLASRVERLVVMCNTTGRNYPLLEAAGVQVIPLTVKSRFDRDATRLIREEVERGDYDIVQAFNSRALPCVLRAAKRHRARLLGYRGVTTGVSYLKPESWHTYLSPRLDGIFCVAEAVRQSLLAVSFLWWRFPAHKAQTVYKGHERAWYDVPPVSPSTFGVPEGARTLCCLSRNSAKKGVTTLLDAFDRLPSDLNAHLLLVGRIDANEEVRERISRCAHPERVHFAGYRDDAVAIIRGSDVLVSASESGEGLPRVVIEAMCVDTPVVATAAGGTDELVLDGETGLLVPQRDPDALAVAVSRTLADEQATAQRVAAARRRIDDVFHADQTVDNTLAWYQQLLTR